MLDQFEPSDFEKMLCIENGNVLKNFFILKANENKFIVITLIR